MQTFLPYQEFDKSAQVLDYKRLGKQRLEAMQLVNSILKLEQNPDIKVGWHNHPARKMWIGYLDSLKYYCNIMIDEWQKRGYNNNMTKYTIPDSFSLPPWLGDDKIHSSHRANLLRKDFNFYSKFGWTESPETPYYWPVT
jgi:hypothetical protein